MSNPNILGYSVAIGFFRNDKVFDLKQEFRRLIPLKIDFAEIGPLCFLAGLAYCAENQTDGIVSGLSDEKWHSILRWNSIEVTPKQATVIRQTFEKVGLIKDGKISSWADFNPHLVAHKKVKKDRRKAGKARAKLYEQKKLEDIKESLKNPAKFPSEPAPKPEKNGSGNGAKTHTETRELWGIDKKLELIDRQLQSAQGEERKELLAERKKLLSKGTGVPARQATRAPAAPSKPTPKVSPREFERTCLNNALQFIADDNAHLISEPMAKALLKAGHEIPASERGRFPKLLDSLGKEEAGNNPVPG